MEIKDLLTEENISLYSDIGSKEQMIRELGRLLMKNKDSEKTDRLIQKIWEREKEGFTGIGNMAALAHAVPDFISEVGLVCIRSEQKIDWALEHNVKKHRMVRLVFLFVVPESMMDDEDREELEVLKQLVLRVGNRDVSQKLLEALDQKEFIDVLSK